MSGSFSFSSTAFLLLLRCAHRSGFHIRHGSPADYASGNDEKGKNAAANLNQKSIVFLFF